MDMATNLHIKIMMIPVLLPEYRQADETVALIVVRGGQDNPPRPNGGEVTHFDQSSRHQRAMNRDMAEIAQFNAPTCPVEPRKIINDRLIAYGNVFGVDQFCEGPDFCVFTKRGIAGKT